VGGIIIHLATPVVEENLNSASVVSNLAELVILLCQGVARLSYLNRKFEKLCGSI